MQKDGGGAKRRRLQRFFGRRRKEDASTPSPIARTTLLQAANRQEDVSPTLLPKMPRHLIGEGGRMQHGLTTFAGNPCSGAPTASPTVPNNASNTSSGRRLSDHQIDTKTVQTHLHCSAPTLLLSPDDGATTCSPKMTLERRLKCTWNGVAIRRQNTTPSYGGSHRQWHPHCPSPLIPESDYRY